MALQPQPPFDFQRTLKFILSPPVLLNGRIFPPLLDHFEKGEYRRVVRISGKPVLYSVSDDGVPDAPRLKVKVLHGPGGKEVCQSIEKVAARQFATDLDPTPFHRVAGQDKVLEKLVERFRGMRIPQALSVYESVVCAILEQQVNLPFAHQVKRALVETYGETIEFDGRRYSTFPEPHALAATTRNCGRSRYRAQRPAISLKSPAPWWMAKLTWRDCFPPRPKRPARGYWNTRESARGRPNMSACAHWASWTTCLRPT
jgi:hypothetical protein